MSDAVLETDPKAQKRNITPEQLLQRVLGRLQMGVLGRTFFTLLELRQLKELKESGLYKEAGMTWDETCLEIGHSVRNVDRMLNNYNELGEELLDTVSNFGLAFSSRTIDSIRMLPAELRPVIEDGDVVIRWDGGEQRIKADPSNRSALQLAINKIQEEFRTEKRAREKVEKERAVREGSLERQLGEMGEELERLRAIGLQSDLPEQAAAQLERANSAMIEAITALTSMDMRALLRSPEGMGRAMQVTATIETLNNNLKLTLYQLLDETSLDEPEKIMPEDIDR